ncbi:MAG: gamma-glutamylcyclotransferase [Hyphomicrobiaceae bacterium]|nr:gamma-glutamylcyclotransferase [Hyphomicrobiaceae bacterium]
MRLYFAYGSNMCAAQMAFRCPGARAVGRAVLHDWRFHANTRGSAAIRPNRGAIVHGVLWRCTPAHFHILDKFEGVAWGNYLRRHVGIEMPCGSRASAITYVGTRSYDGRARVRYMMTAVLPGAEAFELPPAYIDELKSWLPNGVIGEKRVPVRRAARPVRFLR